MSNPWFRLYSEAIDDDKLRLLAFEDRWHFVAILCCKNMGILDAMTAITRRRIAVRMGLDVRELGEVARRLSEVGLIDEDTLQPKKWDDRQYKSDSSLERVRKFRDKTKGTDNTNKSDVKRPCNVTVTLQDTETDTDTEQKEHSAHQGFAVFWDAYPKHPRKQAKGKCLEIWKRKRYEKHLEEILAHLEFSKSEWLKEDNKYVPMPSSYLNKQGWDGWEPVSVNSEWVTK